MGSLNPYAKAIIGGLVAGAAMLTKCTQDDVLTWAEGAQVFGATLTGFLAVWAMPNTPAPPSTK